MLDFFENISDDGANIPALASIRQKGKAAYRGLPGLKDESFKYTPVQNVFEPSMCQTTKPCHTHEHCTCHDKYLDFDAYEFSFCNGYLHEHFHPVPGIEISSLTDALAEHEAAKYINKFDLPDFPFAALNTALLDQGAFMRISKPLDKPIALIYHANQSGLINIRNLIVLEKGAKAELIEIFEGDDKPYFTNITNEIFIGKGASLAHAKLQNEGTNSVHISFANVAVKESGNYQSHILQIGAKLARCETHVTLKEENAAATVNAAYNISNAQTSDITTNIEHISERTLSNQTVRGVIDDRAHGVFQGKIHIAPDAQKTEGHQQHKALLLSADATLDAKPELEIFADDVRCSHGTASGDLNKDELFYLKSRGINEPLARKILTSAFLQTAFETIENSNIRAFLTNAL